MMNPARWLLGATSALPSEPRPVDGENKLQPSLDELQAHGRMTWSEAQHRWIAAPDDVVEAALEDGSAPGSRLQQLRARSVHGRRRRKLIASKSGECGGTRRDAATKEALMNTQEHRDDHSQRLGTVSPAPTKFIQICASQNDLFALDKDGNIYQYNFNAKAWIKLVASRSYEEPA